MTFLFPQSAIFWNLAPPESVMRRISPLPKVCFTIGFLFLTVSFIRYDWRGCVCFAILPFSLAVVSGISVKGLFLRTLPALPFVLCAGVANLFFDVTPVETVGAISLSGGVVSLLVLVCKTIASVGMVLILSASTSMRDLSGALVRLHVPCILVLQLQLLLRYLVLLLEEARNVSNAYFLRNPACRVIPVKDWGALVGRLFLRSVERANAVYQAMLCRLFQGRNPLPASSGGSFMEWGGTIILLGILCYLRVIL